MTGIVIEHFHGAVTGPSSPRPSSWRRSCDISERYGAAPSQCAPSRQRPLKLDKAPQTTVNCWLTDVPLRTVTTISRLRWSDFE